MKKTFLNLLINYRNEVIVILEIFTKLTKFGIV